jgi:PAS domain S-box-containing protein
MRTLASPAVSPRVLVAEDEQLIVEEIQERLTRLGFHVVGMVDTGEEAIRTAHRELPELILMDIRLKGKMDGIEAAAEIRRDLNIPIIYLTAHSDTGTRRRAMETTPCGYVLKPFREEDLLVAMETALHLNRQEKRLRESEARYAATLGSIVDGVVATDEDGRLTFMNPVAEELTGWGFASAKGLAIEKVLKLVDSVTNKAVENPVRRALRQRVPVVPTDVQLLIGRDGSRIPVDDNAAPITTDDGVVMGAVIAFRDLRGRRLMENALSKAEEQVRRSQKMDAIGRLAGGVAHDFNNLLTIINGCANLALDGHDVSAATRDLLKDIEDAGARAASLTNQLLAFSRKQVMAPAILNLNTVVEDMKSMLRRIVPEDIELTLRLSPSLGHVRADPSQIEQVVMNLVVNAREAMNPGGRLTIETRNINVDDLSEVEDAANLEDSGAIKQPELKPGLYTMLAVTDTGRGMSRGTVAQVFEPFFTTKGFKKGTGLGLATVHGIIVQSGGEIFIESEVNRGSKFSIYLPQVEGVPAAAVAGQAGGGADQSLAGTETILLVEDEDGVRSILSSVLRRFGYKVLAARSGKEAIAICQIPNESIDLLMTDVVMPEMGGRELAKRVHALRPRIPILYLSGYIDDALLRNGLMEEGSFFLRKPVAPHVLALNVRQILDNMIKVNDYSRASAGNSA